MRAPLVPITLAFIGGILLGMPQRLPLAALAAAGGCAAAAAIAWRRRPRAGLAALLALWAVLGCLRAQREPARPAGEGQARTVALHGIIADQPSLIRGARGWSAHAATIAVRHVREGPSWRPASGRVRALLDRRGSPPPAYGDELLLEGRRMPPRGPGNPGEYDRPQALARRGIGATVRVRASDAVVTLRSGQGHPVMAAVLALRRRWEAVIASSADGDDEGVLRALLLGQRGTLSERASERFVTTGTVHLLVVSGFNVGVVALLLEWLLRLAGFGRGTRLAVSAAALAGYCLLTGMEPPVVRATLMAWVILGALALDRVVSWPNTLALAAGVMLWINPAELGDPGFQLSYGAVLSLLVLVPRWQAWLEQRLAWIRVRWVPRYLAAGLSGTAAVWVGLSPVLAWYFQLFSPVSMVANLLLSPLLGLAVGFGTFCLLGAAVYAPVFSWGSGLLLGLVHAASQCVAWCHALPGGFWWVARPPRAWLAVYYGLLVLTLMRGRVGWTGGRIACCWAAAAVVAVWALVAGRVAASRDTRLTILDVGHGDCLLVRTPAGRTMLVDAGSADAGTRRVVPFLRREGITRLDALVLTHTDEDHVGGAAAVLGAVRVAHLLTNGVRGDTMSARNVRRIAQERQVPHTALSAGMRLSGEPRFAIEVLHPPRGLVPGSPPVSNDNSLVLRLVAGRVAMLLTGDIEEQGLTWLLAQRPAIRAAVLKVPHHGSRLGEPGERFFARVRPSLAVISVGEAHGLPAGETVERLRRLGALIRTTREHGAIQVRTNGERVTVRAFRQGRRESVEATE